MKRIGILGGSFNPIHHGHLLMAQAALEGMKLDQVIFVPACCSPHKTDRDLAPAEHRLAMVQAAIKDNPCFAVSDVEICRGGKSYTVDTLRAFKDLYPKAKLFFIIGQDSVLDLPKWKDIDAIGKMAEFIATNRPGFGVYRTKAPVKIHNVLMPGVEISSSDIRQRIKKKKSIQYLTPEAVVSYIQQNKY